MTTPPSSNPRPSAFASRRDFIKLGLAAVGAAWLGTLLQTRLFPSTSASAQAQPVSFPLSELPVGGTKTVRYGALSVLVLRTPESLRAFSLTCTHLGCTVQWQPGSKEFYCPCHDGRFDEFGEVLAGPPPLPLEQVAARIEGQTVIVGES